MAETTMEAVPIPTEEPKREKKKRKFSFPSAFTILFIVTIIAVICTWFVPPASTRSCSTIPRAANWR